MPRRMRQAVPGLSTGHTGREPGRWRHPQLLPMGPGSPFTHPRMPVASKDPRLAPSPWQLEEGMPPLLSCCLRLEGIHYLPGYRQLSKAIFQLCTFKELIGGEIILSRRSCRRHNFIRLPWGLPMLTGGPGSPGSAPASTPGDTVLLSPPPVLGSPGWHRGGPSTAPHLGVPLPCPCPGSFAPHFPPYSHCSALRGGYTKPGAGSPARHSTVCRIRPCQHYPPAGPVGDQAPQGTGEAAGSACTLHPMGQPCPPALWLKSIIQIILAWRHSSVAVMNSSEARRGRAHTLLITVADVCFLPQPPPRTETPTSTHIPRDIVSPRCIVPVGVVHPADTGMARHSSRGHSQATCPLP